MVNFDNDTKNSKVISKILKTVLKFARTICSPSFYTMVTLILQIENFHAIYP